MSKHKLAILSLLAILLLTSCSTKEKPVQLGTELTATQTISSSESNSTETSEEAKSDEVFDINKYADHLTIRFFNMEKIGTRMGDSIFIRTPDGITMLIDSGEMSRGPVIAEYLRKMGIEKLDYAVGTHFHTDHVNGFQTILKEISVGKFIMPQFNNYETTVSKALFDMLEVQNIPIEYAIAGNSFKLGDLVDVEVLNPEGDMTVPEGIDLVTNDVYVNDRSVVLKLTFGEQSFIFAGDIYKSREYELYKTLSDKLDADLLKAPHHGLRSSSSIDFVDSVSAGIVVITSGIPDKEIYDRYRRRGSEVYLTGADGTILVVSDGKKMKVLCERDRELKKYYN